MSKTSPVKIELTFLQDFVNDQTTVKVIIHNIQSLKKHFYYFKNDTFYISADIICLNETYG